ncbi:MAG TPA: preprotein translocase subunit SecG [Burkholderiales bacterium]|nr:preprotein translocase subunit SecG [Burkholderiales bacterium]
MEMWMNVVVALHVLIALAIIGLVLLQHGKGADMGSGFGSGSSGSLFGATGSANFLSRATAVLATIFFLTSLGLAYLATNKPRSSGGVLDAAKKELSVPAAPVPAKPAAEAPAEAPKAATPPAEGSKAKDVPQ